MGGPARAKKKGTAAAAVEDTAGKDGIERTLKTFDSVSSEELQHILDDLDAEVAKRVKRMRMEADQQVVELQNAFYVELMKLPKSVRSMSLREFSERYGEDIRTVMRSTVEKETNKAMAMTETGGAATSAGGTGTVMKAPKPAAKQERTTGSKSRTVTGSAESCASSKVAQTPGPSTRTTRSRAAGGTKAAETPAAKLHPRLPNPPVVRAPRRGESILSINGSPLAVATTLGGTAASAESDAPLPLSDAAMSVIKDPALLESMTDELKAEVQKQIERFQGGLQALLQRIQMPPTQDGVAASEVLQSEAGQAMEEGEEGCRPR